MKKVVILIFCSTFLFIPKQLISQKTVKQEVDKYYWFSLKLKTAIGEETKKPKVNIKRLYSKVYSGTFNQYAAFYKKRLEKNKIAIGPYANKMLAKKALKFYRFTNFNDKQAEEYIKAYPGNDSTYYWYFVDPIKTNEHQQKFQRTAARVAYGSIREFLQIVHEGLGFMKFAIGPFEYELNAEKSKYIFRKYGEMDAENLEGEYEIPPDMKEMAEKWKTVEIKANVSYLLDNEDFAVLEYKINIPSEYFNKNTIQVITVLAEIEGSAGIISKYNTLQGSEVRDNNPVVVYERGAAKSYKTTFINQGHKNITLIFKSTLITNTAIYECEDRKITIESD